MAYTASEISEILTNVLAKPKVEVKYKNYKKLGVLIDKTKNAIANLNTCSFCDKKFLSSHLLNLHIAEIHDSFFELQKNRKASYECYLQACSHVSSTQEERKDHAIKFHHFPHNFVEFSAAKKLPENNHAKGSRKNFHFGQKTQKTFAPKGSIRKSNGSDICMLELKSALEDSQQ